MIKRRLWIVYGTIIAAAIIGAVYLESTWKPQSTMPVTYSGSEITLPQPRYDSSISVEEALRQRRSIREYSPEALSLEDVSQLLWAAQGITAEGYMRTAPSAGGTYPLELYVIAGNVIGLEPGVYHYKPVDHSLTRIQSGDYRSSLQDASGGQQWVGDAAFDIIITGVYNRTTNVYGERGIRYVHLEAGHTSQNIYLQAAALGLGTVAVGAFDDQKVIGVLNATEKETPLYIMPVGRI